MSDIFDLKGRRALVTGAAGHWRRQSWRARRGAHWAPYDDRLRRNRSTQTAQPAYPEKSARPHLLWRLAISPFLRATPRRSAYPRP